MSLHYSEDSPPNQPPPSHPFEGPSLDRLARDVGELAARVSVFETRFELLQQQFKKVTDRQTVVLSTVLVVAQIVLELVR